MKETIIILKSLKRVYKYKSSNLSKNLDFKQIIVMKFNISCSHKYKLKVLELKEISCFFITIRIWGFQSFNKFSVSNTSN